MEVPVNMCTNAVNNAKINIKEEQVKILAHIPEFAERKEIKNRIWSQVALFNYTITEMITNVFDETKKRI